MTGSRPQIEVEEVYKDYVSPVNAARSIRVLLRYVPRSYLGGIKAVVLTNSSGLSRERRREVCKSRKRKLRVAESAGSYRQDSRGAKAWIEIYVDNAIEEVPRWVLRFPPLRNLVFAWVLYHEIGHHIHSTKRPEHREPENVADRYRSQLTRTFVWRRYWYLMPVLWLFDVYPEWCE